MDISGNFKEGKGVTGWCLAETREQTIHIVQYGTVCAEQYNSAEEYWQANVKLITRFFKVYPELHVVIEDYLLYASKAKSQINSKLETSQLLGILKYYCYTNCIIYKIQTASEVKTRWTDARLQHRGVSLPNFKNARHVKDAIRHAMHYGVFYKGG